MVGCGSVGITGAERPNWSFKPNRRSPISRQSHGSISASLRPTRRGRLNYGVRRPWLGIRELLDVGHTARRIPRLCARTSRSKDLRLWGSFLPSSIRAIRTCKRGAHSARRHFVRSEIGRMRWQNKPTLQSSASSVMSPFAHSMAGPPNNAFKPNPLRYAPHMAERACHVVRSTTQVGLT